MKRKIVQHGSSSLTITLPIKWVQKYNLKKGDELSVEETGPMIQVSTGQEILSPKKVISLNEYGVFTKNNLSHLYQLGYDDIEIEFENHTQLEELQSRLPECIGFEIIDQKKNKVYIKCIATTLESEFDTLLRKSFLITNEMAHELMHAIEAHDYRKLKEIRNMESLNNKFTDVCIRILNKKGYKVQKRTMQMYEVIKNIERIADEFKYICDVLIESSKNIDREMLQNFRDAVDYYLTFYEIYYKFSRDLAKKIYDHRRILVKRYSSALLKSKAEISLLLHHLLNIIEKTYSGAGGYFALTL
jgi:phosphate uptake regulator